MEPNTKWLILYNHAYVGDDEWDWITGYVFCNNWESVLHTIDYLEAAYNKSGILVIDGIYRCGESIEKRECNVLISNAKMKRIQEQKLNEKIATKEERKQQYLELQKEFGQVEDATTGL